MKPDLTEYLGTKTVAKSKFLKYKSLLERSEGRRAWYEPTFEEQFEKFFSDTDWNKVDSNVERLPYLAYMLGKNTKTVVDKPAADSELFTFAEDDNWKDKLNSDKLKKLSALITDYERCLSRIRACGQPVKDRAVSLSKTDSAGTTFSAYCTAVVRTVNTTQICCIPCFRAYLPRG